MMQPLNTPSCSPAMASSCESQTAYSSAVRVLSVAARHWAIQRWPSWTANMVLVLPCAMASSMCSASPEEDVACGDPFHGAVVQPQPQRAVRIHAFGHALRRAVRQPRLAALAESVGPRRPRLGDRREAFRLPDPAPALEA